MHYCRAEENHAAHALGSFGCLGADPKAVWAPLLSYNFSYSFSSLLSKYLPGTSETMYISCFHVTVHSVEEITAHTIFSKKKKKRKTSCIDWRSASSLWERCRCGGFKVGGFPYLFFPGEYPTSKKKKSLLQDIIHRIHHNHHFVLAFFLPLFILLSYITSWPQFPHLSLLPVPSPDFSFTFPDWSHTHSIPTPGKCSCSLQCWKLNLEP